MLWHDSVSRCNAAGQRKSIINQDLHHLVSPTLRRPTTWNDLAYRGTSFRGGGRTDGRRGLNTAHLYSETTIKARERLMLKDKIIKALKLLTSAGTFGIWWYFVHPFVVWMM